MGKISTSDSLMGCFTDNGHLRSTITAIIFYSDINKQLRSVIIACSKRTRCDVVFYLVSQSNWTGSVAKQLPSPYYNSFSLCYGCIQMQCPSVVNRRHHPIIIITTRSSCSGQHRLASWRSRRGSSGRENVLENAYGKCTCVLNYGQEGKYSDKRRYTDRAVKFSQSSNSCGWC